jgi:anti-sigma regulatory factor (Ser/Thr protein kinase)
MKIGGLGLYLMQQAMDDVQFEFGAPGPGWKSRKVNRLTLTKYV